MNDKNDKKEEKQRTLKQNNALHKYFELVADALNSAGLDMKAVLKPEIDIPWTTETVKEFLWRPTQRIYIGKESTTQLTTKEIDLVFDTLNRFLGEKHGIHEPFPSIEQIIYENTLPTSRNTRS
jgi:hypothetical protein